MRMFKSVSSFSKIPEVLQSSSSSVSSTLIYPYFTCLEPVVVLFFVRVICTILAGHNLYYTNIVLGQMSREGRERETETERERQRERWDGG